MNITWLKYPIRGDERGSLIALEAGRDTPFEIKRIYYIFGTQPDVSRGFHAHRSLRQIMICVSGSARLVLDDGKQQESLLLDDPSRAVIIEPWVWHEMHDFTPDCVLVVLASDHYDEADYIRNRADFIKYVQTS